MRNDDRFDLVIKMKDSEDEEWNDSDETEYTWGVGPAGDLMIFKTTYHAAFAAQLNKDKRVFCYAPGTWLHVEITQQLEAEVSDGSTLLQSDSKYAH